MQGAYIPDYKKTLRLYINIYDTLKLLQDNIHNYIITTFKFILQN